MDLGFNIQVEKEVIRVVEWEEMARAKERV